MNADPRLFLKDLFGHAVSAVRPQNAMTGFWPERPVNGKIWVVGAGKAAAAMAQAAEAHYGDDIEGVVVTRQGYLLPTRKIEVLEASHPVPDERSVVAARQIFQTVQHAQRGDLIVGLWSGGASALMVAPLPGLTLTEKQHINSALLKSGASITEINCVRKHLSAIKGGRLAAAARDVPFISLIISDVVGDDLSVIASGPTVVDPTTCADALNVLSRYSLAVSPHVHSHLVSGEWESPKLIPQNIANHLVSKPADIFIAAQAYCEAANYRVLYLGDTFDGFAHDVASHHAELVRQIRAGQASVRAPCVLLSGGEAVVKVIGHGEGGPNTEFALALAKKLDGIDGVYALACDSDGSDGIGRHAGAVTTPSTLARAADLRLDLADHQTRNDTATFFDRLGDLVVTGPTYTNVNDFRAILIL